MTTSDISRVLQEWPYDPGKMNVRIIEASDGREVLQLRVELGIVQMEVFGRPDGVLQDGYSSLLDLFEDRGTHGGLDSEMCRRLREEGVQRSHRAAAFFSMSRWEEVIRDCTENLHLFDLCNQNANEEHDRIALEQFRAPVIALRTRSAAEWAIELENTVEAMASIDQGLEALRNALGDDWEGSNEAQLLQGMKEALVPRLPTSERADLQERLATAIENENYELATILRDEIRLLRD
jgi:hypothetical protein|tara:strand:- start:37 stop:747 length:711 start_codon:yes stop_codon:yes gene_type:complete